MSPLDCLAALLRALLYFLAFSLPPAPVGSDEGSMVMPLKVLQTLLLVGAGAAPAGAIASAAPVAETAATHRTRTSLRIEVLPARGHPEDGEPPVPEPE